MGWIPIAKYWDFYDRPHGVAIAVGEKIYVLENAFDEVADDYSEFYSILEIEGIGFGDLDVMSGAELVRMGRRCGQVPVSRLAFDDLSSRRRMSDSILGFLPGGAETQLQPADQQQLLETTVTLDLANMRAILVRLVAHGADRDLLVNELAGLAEGLEEREAEHIRNGMDLLTGWCGPAFKI